MNSKVFIITGTSSGLGEALTDVILQGAKHRVVSLSRKSLSKHCEFEKFHHLFLDLSVVRIEHLFPELVKLIGESYPVFINNASIIEPISNTGDWLEEDITNHITTNLTTPVMLFNQVARYFRENKISIINISSGAANTAIEGWGLYCLSKSASSMFFDILQKENPIWKVKNVDPGVLDTKMQSKIRNSSFKSVEYFKNLKKEGNLLQPIDAAMNILKAYL